MKNAGYEKAVIGLLSKGCAAFAVVAPLICDINLLAPLLLVIFGPFSYVFVDITWGTWFSALSIIIPISKS